MFVLKNNQTTRNSDKLLTWKVWQEFYDILDSITISKFMQLPSEDSIKRVRVKIQNNKKMYVPTSTLA